MLSNELKKQAKAREMIMAGVFIVMVSVLGFNNYYTPTKKRGMERNDELTRITDQEEATQKFMQALLEKQQQERSQSKKTVTQVVSENPRVQMIQGNKEPDYKTINDFLNAITKPNFKTSLEINSLNYNEPKKGNGFNTTRFSLVAHGQFSSVVDFIERLEDISALVSIDKLNIDVDKTDNRLVTLELVGLFYKLKDDNV